MKNAIIKVENAKNAIIKAENAFILSKKILDINYLHANLQCLSIYTKYQNVPEKIRKKGVFLIQVISKQYHVKLQREVTLKN